MNELVIVEGGVWMVGEVDDEGFMSMRPFDDDEVIVVSIRY